MERRGSEGREAESDCVDSKGLPSTHSCSGRVRGGDLLFLAERARADPLPGLRCRAVVVPSSLRTHDHPAAIKKTVQFYEKGSYLLRRH